MEWISVNDRLPTPDMDVLVYTGRYYEVKHYVPPMDNYCWGWYPGGLPIENSTHWMPLPKEPSE